MSTSTMLAGRFHLDTLPFAAEEVPAPVPGPGEVLVGNRRALSDSLPYGPQLTEEADRRPAVA
ncbi:hypothetical protein [Streptomyces sp. NPDC015414]|uniref:hypothetical protein n=1 Tax=Streptomyces sp. NPDC015414 TaxID=3364957 RepID=UPI003703594B